MSTSAPTTLGQLKQSGYRPRSIKDELRENLTEALKTNRPLFPGLVGFDKTVVPQLINAILARHDLILLGLRGQAKTRLARMLVSLLDEQVPILPGLPLNEDPMAPISDAGRARVAEQGDDTPIEWLDRDRRYGEKLATPDVSMADLIGDIDPIKAANLRLDYASPEVIHYGIIPRTNRGIFCVNELPDLSPRIQVGLLNILQERDIQIRGFPVRIEMDVLLVFTANPEDYTNRGSIITPLKDRIQSQILTHYPRRVEEAMKITDHEAWVARPGGVGVHVPQFCKKIVEQVAFCARQSEFLDQSSGVSARLPISLMESVISNAERRGLMTGEPMVSVRPIDFQQAICAFTCKVELVYQGEQEGAANVARHLVGRAVRSVADESLPQLDSDSSDRDTGPLSLEEEDSSGQAPEVFGEYQKIVDHFSAGHRLELADIEPRGRTFEALSAVPGLEELARRCVPMENV
ncbi:MAG: sigma 54-interacting transcriptional regulator, partial [Phycisphaeraceae bacterium]|nr:sigma 54-interacting transcriptional regulator [Phycisphaeraceae bacterium]